jgi:hypothetical protein
LEIIEKNKGPGKRDFLFLALCIFLVVIFIFYLGPLMEPYLGLKPVAEEIDRRDINANMYFYTEVDEFFEAQVIMTNIREYPVQSKEVISAQAPSSAPLSSAP